MKRVAIVLTVALAGCASVKGPLQVAEQSASTDWHGVATDDDQQRLRGWRDAWISATDAVRKAGDGATLDGDAVLYDIDRALATPAPPPGSYRCHWIKLGSSAKGVAALTDYPPVPCRVTAVGKLLAFRILAGAQRPQGLIFPDEPSREVFLGTLRFADERRALAYGRDEKRDMAGYVERIGPQRWRLILPQPHFESLFDVIEITPAA